LHAVIHIDLQNAAYLVKRQTIGPEDLPAVAQETGGFGHELDMRQSLDELEKLVADAPKKGIDFSRPLTSQVIKMMNSDWRKRGEMYAQIHALYWTVAPSSIDGIIGRVRTALTEMVSELLAALPDDGTPPSKEQVDGAVQYSFTGNRGPIHIANSSATTGATSVATADSTGLPSPATETPRRTFWQRFRDRGVIVGVAQVVGSLAGLAGVYAALAAGLDWWPF
jgi:hypothetical protein